MDPRIEKYASPTKPYYYDIEERKFLIGDKQRDSHIRSTQSAGNVHLLGTLLLDTEIPLPDREREIFKTKDWPRERVIKYGRWLVRILDQVENPEANEPDLTLKPKKLNQTILRRARKLNLGPTADYIKSPNGFGGLSPFYREIKLVETHQVGLFDEWTRQDIVQYLKKVGDELGRRPREKDLLERFHQSRKNPSPALIYDRFGKLRDLVEQAGYVIVQNWDIDDYHSWGVKYMLANDGKVPVQTTLDYLAKKELGPSYNTVASKFSGLPNYQSVVAEMYQQDIDRKNHHRQQLLEGIEAAMDDSSLQELFIESSDESEIIQVYAKYLVVDSIVPEMSTSRKVTIARGDYQDRNFVNSLKKYNSAITTGDVESEALVVGVFDEIWPMDSFMTELKIPESFRNSGVNKRRTHDLEHVAV